MGSSTNQPLSNAILAIFLILSLQLPSPSRSENSDALHDFCIGDTSDYLTTGDNFRCRNATFVDFTFTGLEKEATTSNNIGSNVTKGHVMAFPGLNTQGMSMNRIDIAPGGVNPPHSHPRAAEIGIVIHGQVTVVLISTGNLLYSKTLSNGQVYLIPKGMVHYQWNVGKQKALIYAAYNSQMPRTVLAGLNVFCSRPNVDYGVMRRAFQVNSTFTDNIRLGLNIIQCNALSQIVA